MVAPTFTLQIQVICLTYFFQHLVYHFYAINKSVYLYRVSHKEVEWTETRQMGFLNGIKDNFKFAKNHKLYNLF